jgi:pimeloyl-ACP methyl ester carboxylesterase
MSSRAPVSLLWRCIVLVLRILGILVATVLSIGLILGYFFKVHPWTVGYVVFMNHIHFPPFRNFSDLQSYEVRGENLYLRSGPNQLGVWKLEADFALDTAPVVMYIHGAQGSRAAYHRIQLYRVLQRIGCPVVTFDYRGYGDSTGVPTSELDLLEDATVVYHWTRRQFPGRSIFLWGHSLGVKS